MELRVEIKKLKEVMAAIETAPVTMKREMRLALRESLIAVQRRARLEHNFRTRTGALEKSINYEIMSEWPPIGRVWLDNSAGVNHAGWRLNADTSYGVYVHEGTRAHDIFPRKKKVLRFVGKGGFVNSGVKRIGAMAGESTAA